ncbi:hypothetical protein C2845_PM05G35790 [Panicum miliaceum]|uniref:Uncharacterized protein n=1 Tax=Panicum miliaceum TaxID=4540 RepID=A0A3L6ST93_PANMI|nr:hypothetical protein C2845_PM05G35790 [Panicum miliaceum]
MQGLLEIERWRIRARTMSCEFGGDPHRAPQEGRLHGAWSQPWTKVRARVRTEWRKGKPPLLLLCSRERAAARPARRWVSSCRRCRPRACGCPGEGHNHAAWEGGVPSNRAAAAPQSPIAARRGPEAGRGRKEPPARRCRSSRDGLSSYSWGAAAVGPPRAHPQVHRHAHRRRRRGTLRSRRNSMGNSSGEFAAAGEREGAPLPPRLPTSQSSQSILQIDIESHNPTVRNKKREKRNRSRYYSFQHLPPKLIYYLQNSPACPWEVGKNQWKRGTLRWQAQFGMVTCRPATTGNASACSSGKQNWSRRNQHECQRLA